VQQPGAEQQPPEDEPDESVFVPSAQALARRRLRRQRFALGLLSIMAIAAVLFMVYRPRLKPHQPDAVESAAGAYLDALVRQDDEAIQRLGTVEEPPAIRSHRDLSHRKASDRQTRGSFAPLASFHKRIEDEYTYDATAGRFTPNNAMGIAAETLDALHAAKDSAEKSGLYQKMQSGDPNDLFDAAEQMASATSSLAKLSEGILSPKRLVPTYKMLVESSKPPLKGDAKALATIVAEDPKRWDALLKRPFWTLKADGPFVYETAEVTATGRDQLASLGDPLTSFRLKLVRFRLEGIDTGWKVIEARRVLPEDEQVPVSSAAGR
jgi:hypothetical protein